MAYVPIRRGAGRLFDENLNRMLRDLYTQTALDVSPGSVTVETGTTRTFGKQLALTGSQRLTVAGTARARVIN